MKLLFDQNLSYKLVKSLKNIFPDSSHVRNLDLEEADDLRLWKFAKEENYIIVSKDSDFLQLSFLYGPPPKAIWISRGNCTTSEIEEILENHKQDIEDFSTSSEASFLEID